MSDVGMSRRCAVMKGKCRIPKNALPDDMPNGLKRRMYTVVYIRKRLRCKPDAMMVKTENNTRRYKLIEI
jgi:hypothetical protein